MTQPKLVWGHECEIWIRKEYDIDRGIVVRSCPVYTATGLVLDCRSDEHVDFTFWWGQDVCVCVCVCVCCVGVCVCVCVRVYSDVTLSGAMYSTEYSWSDKGDNTLV